MHQGKRHGKMHICEGTIEEELYIGIVQRYIAIKKMSFMGSPWLTIQDNATSHSANATTGFVDT